MPRSVVLNEVKGLCGFLKNGEQWMKRKKKLEHRGGERFKEIEGAEEAKIKSVGQMCAYLLRAKKKKVSSLENESETKDVCSGGRGGSFCILGPNGT